MLNGDYLLSMMAKPKVNIEIKSPSKRKLVKPFKRTLDGVIKAVSENPNANRKQIIDITEYSNHCVDRCLDYLIENAGLTRSFVRMSGPYKVYNYLTNTSKANPLLVGE